MNQADIIIIGAGPAGLMAAISAGKVMGKAQRQVMLLEANTQCGSKLLLSGSGQCNYTNNLPPDEFLARCNEYANYLKPAYYAFDKQAFMALLQNSGVISLIRPDNKVFPASLQASEVRDALLNQALGAGAKIAYQARVSSLMRNPDGSFTLSMAGGAKLSCAKLILATGGASYPQTGSDGVAVGLAKAMGHQPIAFHPHLCNALVQDYAPFVNCAGISLTTQQAKFTTSKGVIKATGDLLFTHTGLSGPLILDNSYRLSKGDSISLCLVSMADSWLNQLKSQCGATNTINSLRASGIPERLLHVILTSLQIDSALPFRDLPKEQRKNLANVLQDFRFTLTGLGKLSTAMASAGGISLKEINAKSMESRLCPGLFFAGEIMDYALPSGGFNIQIAASTGWLAGKHAAKLGSTI